MKPTSGFTYVAYDEVTGDMVQIGDPVRNFRGERGVLRRLDAARSPGHSGKVAVEAMDHDQMFYHKDTVWGLRVQAEPTGQ